MENEKKPLSPSEEAAQTDADDAQALTEEELAEVAAGGANYLYRAYCPKCKKSYYAGYGFSLHECPD